jgi:hypothetical protein
MPQATQEVISRLPETTGEEFEAAVGAARDAFPAWRRTPVPTRARVMLKLQQLIRENMVRAAQMWCAAKRACEAPGADPVSAQLHVPAIVTSSAELCDSRNVLLSNGPDSSLARAALLEMVRTPCTACASAAHWAAGEPSEGQDFPVRQTILTTGPLRFSGRTGPQRHPGAGQDPRRRAG